MKKRSDLSLLFHYRQALMGIAALWILMTHEWQIISQNGDFIWETERFIKRIGFCGVDIFLLLSGMGMVFSLEKNSLLRFYYNRLKRIIFPFWIMAAVVAFVDQWDKVFFAKVITGVAFFRINIYSFLWFVPAIITFYLVVPLYYYIFRRAKNKYLFTAVVLEIWLLFSLILKDIMRQDLYGFTNRIPIFIAGVLFGWLCREGKVRFTKGTWAALAVTLLLGLYLAYQTNMNGMEILVPVSNCCIPNFLISISLPLLLAKGFELLGRVRSGRISIFFTRVFGFFGMMSLEFYCVQEWIAKKILAGFVEQYGNAASNLLLLIIVITAGLALYLINKFIVWVIDALVSRCSGRCDRAENYKSA